MNQDETNRQAYPNILVVNKLTRKNTGISTLKLKKKKPTTRNSIEVYEI